ncbi:MAG: CmcJ/NvfI family oxidoreductase, partial [Gammaproteobacteria bacterium]
MRRGIEFVEAELPYLAASNSKPYRYTYEPPPGVLKEVGELDYRKTRIWSGWREAPEMTIDRQGFAIGRHPTDFSDFWNREALLRDYYPEMEALVLAHTGALRAIVFDHNLRHAGSTTRSPTAAGKPARLVHNDYTPSSGPQRLRDLLDPTAVQQALEHRFAMINLWRPIQEPLR